MSIPSHRQPAETIRNVAPTVGRALVVRRRLAWLVAGVACQAAGLAAQPYPPSKTIAGIDWQIETRFQHGPGSDQWPVTWAGDDHLYAGWGDGWGWNKAGEKRSLGITRISGVPPNLGGEDLWGIGPGSGVGKPEALIAEGKKIYLFWTVGRSKDDKANSGTAWSVDRGVTWTLNEAKAFPQVPDGFRVRGIAQFGQGYQGNTDGFVYLYFGFSRANDLYLARVPMAHILDASRYEWFAGTTGNQPDWNSQVGRKQPVFTDASGYIWHVGVQFVAGLARFFLTKPHFASGADRSLPEGDRSKCAGLGVYDAPTPWGPWTTVYHTDRFIDGHFKFTFFIPGKFIDSRANSLWLQWSGYPEYDNVNFVRGAYRVR